MTSSPEGMDPRWSTASFGAAPDTTPMELRALGEHVALCTAAGARGVALHCALQRLLGFVLARRVSAMALAALVIGAIWLVV
ncbi:MAG: hypothetical protein KGK09_13395 [Burkholderiales bacterium]|nr:hypothetical protein [Burkholderiales bacterium]